MKLLSTLILSAFVASVQSSKYADVKYDMVATSKSSKSRSISSSSSSKSGKSSYFHDELATQYIRVRAGKADGGGGGGDGGKKSSKEDKQKSSKEDKQKSSKPDKKSSKEDKSSSKSRNVSSKSSSSSRSSRSYSSKSSSSSSSSSRDFRRKDEDKNRCSTHSRTRNANVDFCDDMWYDYCKPSELAKRKNRRTREAIEDYCEYLKIYDGRMATATY
jgi:hypothetical protein